MNHSTRCLNPKNVAVIFREKGSKENKLHEECCRNQICVIFSSLFPITSAYTFLQHLPSLFQKLDCMKNFFLIKIYWRMYSKEFNFTFVLSLERSQSLESCA